MTDTDREQFNVEKVILRFILENFYSLEEAEFKNKLKIFLEEILLENQFLIASVNSLQFDQSGINTAHVILGKILSHNIKALIEPIFGKQYWDIEKRVIQFVLDDYFGLCSSVYLKKLKTIFDEYNIGDSDGMVENVASHLVPIPSGINMARGVVKRIITPENFRFSTECIVIQN